VVLIFVFLVAMNDFPNQPEEAEAKKNPHKGGQMGDRLEHRHRHQGAEPEAEHQLPLERGGFDAKAALHEVGGHHFPPLE